MLNKLQIMGRLGADPETRYTGDGNPVCTFSIATSRKVRGEEQTTWIRVVAFDKKAELCQKYLGKGQRHFFEGELRIREYESNGQKRTSVEMALQNLVFIDKGQEQEKQSNSGDLPPPDDDFDDDIPF